MRDAGSVPFFPPPWPVRDLGRVLAVPAGPRSLVTEDGEVIRYADDAGLVDELFARGLALYVTSLPAWPAFERLRHDPGAIVTCTQDGSPLLLRIRRGRQSRSIVASRVAWGNPATPALLLAVRACHQYLRVPLTSTAASMGQATIRRAWPKDAPIESRPHDSAWRFLRAGVAGGRVDTVLPRKRFAILWEADINDAYLSAARRLPSGTAVYWHGARGEAEPAVGATGFFLACVTIPKGISLALGPFGVRAESGALAYPTHPGTYPAVYLWSEDIALLRSRGIVVELLRGWYWQRWSRALGTWATRMHRLRAQAPAELAPFVKQAIVAAIGRFGGDRVRYRLSETFEPGDRPIVDPVAGPLAVYVRAEPSDRGECLAHWSGYILAAIRRRLWALASPLAERGTLVATNYDAVYSTVRPPGVRPSARLGGVKLATLTNAVVPAARQIVSDGKVRLPGVAGGRAAVEMGLQPSLGLG